MVCRPPEGRESPRRARKQIAVVSLTLNTQTRSIARSVTGRDRSVFSVDLVSRGAELREGIRGSRVLVVGAAGSIGSATLLSILEHEPAEVSVLDVCENNLAELVRTIRGREQGFSGVLRVAPLDYGSPLAAAWMASLRRHDWVLVFAALKHVRSERDEFSALRMLEVNVLGADRFLTAVRRQGHGSRGVFFVSTDKAARPTSLMGASKRVMEQVLWCHASMSAAGLTNDVRAAPLGHVTTARFANVAFSDGSLPWAFLQRLAKDQPMAAPNDVRRFLITQDEAGELCLLATFAGAHRHVMIPKLTEEHTVTFPEIARATLASVGLSPAWYEDEAEARRNVGRERARGAYPVVLTKADTAGEKQMEEFVADGEAAVPSGLDMLDAIEARAVPVETLRELVQSLEGIVGGRAALPSSDELVRLLHTAVPDMRHVASALSLDGRL
jgi:FlaA1/EpsC-like NDP-sugar epimerase